MPGPFPGMDPWLEQHWGDVHTRLVTYCSDQLQKSLPRDLRARVEERVSIDDEDWPRPRVVIPDVQISEYPRASGFGGREEGGVATLAADEPIVIALDEEPVTERFIEIRDFSRGGHLVTVIEVLSPSNKQYGRGRLSYLRKRSELDAAAVNFVEIDFLREGVPLERIPRESVQRGEVAPYFISVHRQHPGRVQMELYPASFRTRLPVIRIPLRPSDPDALLDLQKLIDDAYDRGGYDILDYRQPSVPPLSQADTAWAGDWLKQSRPPVS